MKIKLKKKSAEISRPKRKRHSRRYVVEEDMGEDEEDEEDVYHYQIA